MAHRPSQSLISSFFGQPKKKQRVDQNEEVTDHSQLVSTTSEALEFQVPSCSTAMVATESQSTTASLKRTCPTEAHTSVTSCPGSSFLDIGYYVGQDIDDQTKMTLLEEPWFPPENYSFPFSSRNASGRIVKNYVRLSHLQTHKEWLVLSDIKKGLFCKFCPWFTNRNEGGFCKNVRLKALVTEPLTNFKKLTGCTGDLEVHRNTQYHKDAVRAGKDFLKTFHSPNMEIRNLINEERLSQAQLNRERLLPIVKTIIMLGRQNIPLRGHRDDGPIDINCSVTSNEGNFRAMLRFRVDAGDKVLKNHLEATSSRRATYLSKSTQNEIINSCKEEITCVILRRISQSGTYSIIFDETSDCSNKAQVSLVLRYVHFGEEASIREDFITFIDAFEDMAKADLQDDLQQADVFEEELGEKSDWEDVQTEVRDKEICLNGNSLGQIIVRTIHELNLPPSQCVGIGTDGCGVMLAERGAVREIQKVATNAIMTPCYSHKLNNSISKSSKVTLVEKTVGVLKEVISFFSYPKRNVALRHFLGRKLSHLCETRWSERHDGVLQFTTSLPDIVSALNKIAEWRDKTTARKASILVTALCECQFLIGVFCLSDILSLTLPLSVILQKETLDLARASQLVTNLLGTLDKRRSDSRHYFHDLYTQIENMALKLDVELKKPRLCGRQTKRDNYQVEAVEDYYRISVYIPLMDNISEDLRSRFSPDVLDVLRLPVFLPEATVKLSPSDIDETLGYIVSRFAGFLAGTGSKELNLMKLKGEMSHWQHQWQTKQQSGAKLPTKALHVLQACDRDIYPLIHTLLQILCTLPVSNASSERSFSSLRLIKTWLRTTMVESRLVGLALLFIHKDIILDPDQVIERFAKSGKHRMVL